MDSLDFYSCSRVFQMLDEFLDRELSPVETEQVERHLERCATCAREVRLEQSLLRAMRAKLRRIDMPAGLEGRVWRAVVREQRGRLARPAQD